MIVITFIFHFFRNYKKKNFYDHVENLVLESRRHCSKTRGGHSAMVEIAGIVGHETMVVFHIFIVHNIRNMLHVSKIM